MIAGPDDSHARTASHRMDAAFVLFRTSLLIMDEAAGPGSGLAF
jgi:hypothetical protein